jgi:hypothetical protein
MSILVVSRNPITLCLCDCYYMSSSDANVSAEDGCIVGAAFGASIAKGGL